MNKPYHAKDYWDITGVGYINLGVYYNQWLYRVRRRIFNDHIKALDLNFEQLKVLDIGSGTGFCLDLWKSLGVKSITGSDITDVAVERLKKLYSEFSILQFNIGVSLESQDFFEKKN